MRESRTGHRFATCGHNGFFYTATRAQAAFATFTGAVRRPPARATVIGLAASRCSPAVICYGSGIRGDPSPEVYEFWPTDLLQLFTQAGMPRRRPPPAASRYMPRRRAIGHAATHHLTGYNGDLYRARDAHRRGIDPTLRQRRSEVHRLHWFVDEDYIGTGIPGVAVPWNPQRSGKYIVRAVDDRGRADSRELNVALVR